MGESVAEAAQTPLSLAVYAHVKAAIAEELPLEQVLEHEGIAADCWATEEVVIENQVATDPSSFERYKTALAEAEDRLAREVSPVDRDAAAWLALLAAYRKSSDPFAFLSGLGLRLTDFGRLGRAWERRIKDDASLEPRMAKLLRAELPPVPPLRLGETPFLSSAGVRRRDPATPPPNGPSPFDRAEAPEAHGIGLDRLAALAIELARANDSERVLTRYGLDRETYASVLARFAEAFAGDPSLERDYRLLFAHHEQRMGKPGEDTPLELVSEVPADGAPRRSDGSLTGTAPSLNVPRTADLPFAKSARRAGEVAIPWNPLEETAPPLDLPRAPELPFVSTGAVRSPRAKQAEEQKSRPSKRTTPKVSKRDASVIKPPKSVPDTTPLRDPIRSPTLPFTTPKRPAKSGPETVPLAQAPHGPPLPFVASNLTKPKRFEKSAAFRLPKDLPPPKGRRPSQGKRDVAPLTLEQHASLCVELAVSPERTKEALARYGVTERQKAALDAEFQERFASAPDLRAKWERAYQTYHAWFAAQPR